MAKKKKDEAADDKVSSIDDMIIAEFGKCIVDAEYIKNRNYKIIPTLPKMDVALGKGVSEGTLTIITSPPKLGKTTLCLQIARNALNIPSEYGDRTIIYLNIESRIKERDLYGIKGLDASKVKIISSTSGNILCGEDFLKIAEKIINSYPGCVLIIDSFSSLCSKSRFESDLGGRFRDDMPLFIGSFCRRIAPAISINNTIVLAINHSYANVSGKGHKTTIEASSTKLQYGHDTKLIGTYTSPWLSTDGRNIGLEVNWKVGTTYLAGATGGEVKSYLRFGEGYDEIMEYIDLGIDAGLINKGGGGNFTYKENKSRGVENFRTFLSENENVLDELKTEINNLYIVK